MTKEQAASLVSETFSQRFNEEKFSNFIAEFLNESTLLNPYFSDTIEVPSSFESTIKQSKCLAHYDDPDRNTLDVLIVNLARQTSIRRAQVLQRDFIGWYLGSRNRDSALVSFYHDELDDWRFSYVKIIDHLRQDDQGIIKIDRVKSPPKRFSFLVGKNEPSHTAQRQIVPILVNDRHNPTLSDIEEAFSVETVTKEFFQKYQQLFLDLRDSLDIIASQDPTIKKEFESKNIHTDEFAKKLLGQIVFLYFLQKKGWLGVGRGQEWGSGSSSFLRDKFNQRGNKNFFNDILEPLFYDALRHDRREIDDYHTAFNCKIPFLNGGLFDPINNYDWVNTDINLPDELFSNNQNISWLKSPTEDDLGILDIFDHYNFTVKEDEPLEREVAIDPEMLGKVFESLLGSKERKSKGTFYTPREVVRYMCQESLIHYLCTEIPDSITRENFKSLIKCSEASSGNIDAELTVDQIELLPQSIRENAGFIDQKLASIQICDPAVGSGAFVVGMMNEIVGIRDTLTQIIADDDTTGRDTYNLKREAIQNCLYGVDIDAGAVEIAKLRLWLSLVVDEKDRRSILPLPNLDYKIIHGDSLLKADDQDLFNFDFQELTEKQRLYFEEDNPSRKQILKRRIDELTQAHTGKNFDLKIYFPEIFGDRSQKQDDGFDIVIGNPPYVQLQKMKGTPERELYKSLKYYTYTGLGDIYCLFYECGLLITRQKGVLCYITSNKWMRAGYGKKLRNFFHKNNPVLLIDLGPDIFETATVDTNIIFVEKRENNDSFSGIKLDKRIGINMGDQIDQDSVKITSLSDGPWFIGSQIETNIKYTIDHVGIPLGDWGDNLIKSGIKTGCNAAFLINESTKDQLVAEDYRSFEILKPIFRGRDIKRYGVSPMGNWLIASHNGYIDDDGKEVAPVNIDKYPAVKKHLDEFGERLVNRSDKCVTPYNLRSCGYYVQFENDKIVWPDITHTKPSFHLVKDRKYIEASVFMITSGSLKYLLGILNSSITAFYIPRIATDLGGEGVRYKKQFMEKFPIPKPDKNASSIEELVDMIYSYKEEGKDTTDLEREIDFLVYELYDLGSEEISFLESHLKRNLEIHKHPYSIRGCFNYV
ncbi:MAG: Eco57I restriction-modification methylase domain-containing protein [Bacteroidetes bacterium]|nr:Eco57I restriction-modification methylase domain-containing protein [Bacteroidota bacterium]